MVNGVILIPMNLLVNSKDLSLRKAVNGYVTSDSLELVVQEAQPRLAFLYLNMKSIKKLVTPEVAPDKK